MGTIVTRGVGGGEKRSTEKAVTPKPQMPAVGESCVYTRLPSLAADCAEAECYTCLSAERAAHHQTATALWLHHFQKGITIISSWFRAITDRILLKWVLPKKKTKKKNMSKSKEMFGPIFLC